MKTSTAVALSLATLAVAQPSGHRRHQHLHEKRDDVVTVIDYVTAQLPDVIVYVDEKGNVLSSVTSGQVATPAPVPVTHDKAVPVAPAASSKAATTSIYVAPTPSSASSAAATSAPAASSKAASSAPAASSSASSSPATGPSGRGIVYSPYMDDGSCKTADQVAGDLASISGYDFVRSYGVDCNQVNTLLAACKSKGMKLWLGVFDIHLVTDQINSIIQSVGDDWSHIHTVAIGNEGVNNGKYTVDAVVAAIGTARTLLKATPFSGNIVTVDTFVATIANPALCEASDFAAVNCHAFFDGGVTADGAGQFVLDQMKRVSNACGGKNTWITETGWPSKGGNNGKAIAGVAEQQTAIASIKSTIGSNLILFSAFNDFWKKDFAGTFGAEKYWGVYGSSKYSTSS